ncbi:hypothetical protein SDC9_93999 [bioreactor metagenome]|uniref:Uncharacterized protein n=1 Tax=bioreactor metagenome TaxID=1076179 RepID=A0A645A4V8_9ZZZZ
MNPFRAVTAVPAISEVRAPSNSCPSTSRPASSVPNRCPLPGEAYLFNRSTCMTWLASKKTDPTKTSSKSKLSVPKAITANLSFRNSFSKLRKSTTVLVSSFISWLERFSPAAKEAISVFSSSILPAFFSSSVFNISPLFTFTTSS